MASVSQIEAWTPRVSADDPRLAFAKKPDPRLVLLRTDAVLPIPGAGDLLSVTAPGPGATGTPNLVGQSASGGSPTSRDNTAPTLQAVHSDKQIHKAVAEFCSRHVRVDIASGTVGVPPVFKECWNVFGSSGGAVVRWLATYLPVLHCKPREHWRVIIV